MSSWPASNFHDAELIRARVDWAAATSRLEFIPHGSYPDQPSSILAEGLLEASFARRNPWGPSTSVLEASPPQPTTDGGLRLVVTMQSGDELVVVAERFTLEPATA